MTQERKQRIPFGVPKRKLTIDDATRQRHAGKKLRWINDTDTRVQDAGAGAYEFVTGEVTTGDAKHQENKDRRAKKAVGTNKDGSIRYAYLMAIPEEYYREDQAEKEETNAKVDQAIRSGQPTGLQPHGLKPEQGGTSVKNVEYQP